MSEKPTQYELQGNLYYMCRDRGSELIFAAAKYAAKLEKKGHTLEWVNMYPELGGWAAVILMQNPNEKVG